LEKNDKAKVCYEKAIMINPNYINANYNLGVLFINLKDYQKAKNYFEKIIKINPNYAEAHNNLGILSLNIKKYQKAKDFFEKAIEIDPNFVNAHNNLGILFTQLGEIPNAMASYEKAIKIDPNFKSSINGLSKLFRNKINFTNKRQFKNICLYLFRTNNTNHNNTFYNAKSVFFSEKYDNQINEIINSGSSLLTNKYAQNLFNEELFHLMLQKSLLSDIIFEKLLTKLRCELFFSLDNSNKTILKKYFNLIISLAEQCWLNEYVFNKSEKEITYIKRLKEKIYNEKNINEIEIAILACYIPLNKSKIITNKLLDYKSTNILFNDLINIQVREPLREKELIKSILSLDEIIDPVSKQVQKQYEENPYPRWRYTDQYLIEPFLDSLNKEIKPNKINYNNKFNNPNVLIAGCGTGNHISLINYQNANILGVDLSLASLSYSKRKTKELGFKNIEYLHADILQLKKLNRKFDIIECSGVLHHMKDPIAGLKILLDILEPHGFLKLGLYSETARQHIVKGREFIKKMKFKNTIEGIRACRQKIFDQKQDLLLKKITNSSDFYSISTVRDLLFHVQEHRFTIPEISKILKDLDLEFLGFTFREEFNKNVYSKKFPGDKKNLSLDNWHQFEQANPGIFASMYHFWVRKLN
jgi:tetratricopeptide (TPR) repeat protein